MAGKARSRVRSYVAGCLALLVIVSGTAWAGYEGDNSEEVRNRGPFAPKDCAVPYERPTRIVLRCDSFGIFINGIDWKNWESKRAKGSGLLRFRRCRPGCRGYPVKMELHRVRQELCDDQRLAMFQRIRLEFPRRDPNFGQSDKKLTCGL